MPVAAAISQLGEVPGIYAVSVKTPSCLPPSFEARLLEHGHSCVYIGRTSRGTPSLKRRLGDYDLRGKGDSTFFSAIGLVLGYRPPVGSLVGKKDDNNFRFTGSDKERLATWIEINLVVAWRVLEVATVEELESQLIRATKPLLNWQHNPARLPELKVLRDEARKLARSPAPRR